MLCCWRRRKLLLRWVETGSSWRAVVKKAALPGALVAVVAAEVCVPVLPAPALRCGMVPTADLAEDKRAWVACAAERRAGHVPIGATRIQPWMLILLLPGHLVDKDRLLLLLRLEVADGWRLCGLLTPCLLLLLLLLRLWEGWPLLLLLLGRLLVLLTAVVAAASAISWGRRRRSR